MALVKSSKIMTVAMMVVSAAYATSPYDDQIGSVLEDMVSTNREVRLNVTNRLDALIEVTTNGNQLATCKLLKASILLDYSENMADTVAFDCVTNICREIEADLSGLYAWQRIGALSIFANAMIDDGHPEVAFVASTNLLSIFTGNQCLGVDTNIWDVLFKPGGMDVMPPMDFIRANAAASLFKMNPNADLSPYTNGVPIEVLREIIEVGIDE